MNRAVDELGRVVAQKEVGPGLFHLVVEAPGIAKAARPGQFVQLRIGSGLDPLLRRPMSIARASGRRIEMLYQTAGSGTQVLSQRRRGEGLQILGPLGKGFTMPRSKTDPVLVGGGTGVPPLLFLAERAGQKGSAFLGARNREVLLGEEKLRQLGWKVIITTDDGSKGTEGFVSEEFARRIRTFSRSARIYACGPLPMLAEVARLCAEADLHCEVSLEAMMACGLGVCRGCVVPVHGERKYRDICREGPAIDSREIDWSVWTRKT